ncbi:hypothetical protein [Streptosporangium carneum]|uniref:Uncharacterized protein n=1 Tax=Streptosporangium carneum TaxID=47481 RepID=A0A9W6MC28_9ACTN|nr:hypothetical protein GCM10017600_18150 [Streptosporangium carneum]
MPPTVGEHTADRTAMDGGRMDGETDGEGEVGGAVGGAVGNATEASNSGPLRDGLHGLVMASSSARMPMAERGDIK